MAEVPGRASEPGAPARILRTSRARWVHGTLVVAAATIVIALTHDLGYLLSWPLWGDEAWVAISRKFPLSDLPSLISSTPIGWNLLVQQFAVFGDAGGRLLVQLFNVATTVVAYAIGYRLLPDRSTRDRVLAGVLVASAFAFSPATLTRVDLKHYTADAFVVVAGLAFVLIYSRRPTLRRLVAFTVVSSFALVLSFASLFASVSVFAALVVCAILERDRAHVRRLLVGGIISVAGMAAWYFAFYTRGDIPALRDFWKSQYPQSLIDLPRFVAARLVIIDDQVVFQLAGVVAVLALGATILLWRRGSRSAALYAPFMLSVMIALGLLQRYPLLDARTSHFFLMLASVLCGVALVLIVDVAATRMRRLPGRTSGLAVPVAMIAMTALVIGLAVPNIRAHSLPGYDTTSQVEYTLEHMRPGDLVLYNQLASYQLGMTWPRDEPSWCPNPEAWTGFDVCYPGVDDLKPFYSLDEAYRLIDEHLRAYPSSRVWLIRSHVFLEYEQMEKTLPTLYDYEVIDLPIQPLGVVRGFADRP